MVAYHQFVELSQSADSEERGQAAHMAARAYLAHSGPADEAAALYAALIGFLDDPSVKVRAALAYALLHAVEAPRPILLALLQDAGVIARAVLQYSPALLDADLIMAIRAGDLTTLLAVTERDQLSLRVAEALVARSEQKVTLRVLARTDVTLSPATLRHLVETQGDDAAMRGALLARQDLDPALRLVLVEAVGQALRGLRIVKGAVAAPRLERLLRNATDTALSAIGEREAGLARRDYAAKLVGAERDNTRVMLHAIINGTASIGSSTCSKMPPATAEKAKPARPETKAPENTAMLSSKNDPTSLMSDPPAGHGFMRWSGWKR